MSIASTPSPNRYAVLASRPVYSIHVKATKLPVGTIVPSRLLLAAVDASTAAASRDDARCQRFLADDDLRLTAR